MFTRFTFVLLIFIVSTQITGCTAFVKSHYVPNTGKSSVTVGEVGVKKSLDFIGETIDDTLLVSADENGNGIISAGKGMLEVVPFLLNSQARNETIDYLKKLKKWGETANREKVEISKYVGSLTSKMGILGGTSLLVLDFISTADGHSWVGKLNFCHVASALARTKPIGSSPCEREVSVYINPSSTSKLITLLEKVPEYSGKANYTKSKDELFN